MAVTKYFPATNPQTKPGQLNAEGYYWLGWSVENPSFDSAYFAQQSIIYGTKLADDNTVVDPYKFYRYLPTQLALNIPEFTVAYFNAVNRADNGVIEYDPNGYIKQLLDNGQPQFFQPWNQSPRSTASLNDNKVDPVLNQWRNVIDFDSSNMKITFAYVQGSSIGSPRRAQ